MAICITFEKDYISLFANVKMYAKNTQCRVSIHTSEVKHKAVFTLLEVRFLIHFYMRIMGNSQIFALERRQFTVKF